MSYQSDLKQEEWDKIKHFFDRKNSNAAGRKGIHSKQHLVNAVLYVTKGGIPWRMMPKDFPSWKTVYTFFRRACKQGIWEKILDFLNKEYRKKLKRNEMPSFAIVDSQSVKTIYKSEDIGFDGGKKIKGRKRHIAVDALGSLLHVAVHAANQHDTTSGIAIFEKTICKYPTIQAFCADEGYRGSSADFVRHGLGLNIFITKKLGHSFTIIPKRWIVERTLAWIGNFRRLAKDFEITSYIAENIVRIAMLKIMLARFI